MTCSGEAGACDGGAPGGGAAPAPGGPGGGVIEDTGLFLTRGFELTRKGSFFTASAFSTHVGFLTSDDLGRTTLWHYVSPGAGQNIKWPQNLFQDLEAIELSCRLTKEIRGTR